MDCASTKFLIELFFFLFFFSYSSLQEKQKSRTNALQTEEYWITSKSVTTLRCNKVGVMSYEEASDVTVLVRSRCENSCVRTVDRSGKLEKSRKGQYLSERNKQSL
jgi:hypothetical protein